MDCSRFTLKPWQKRVCVGVGFGSGVVGMYTTWRYHREIGDGVSRVIQWFRDLFPENTRYPDISPPPSRPPITVTWVEPSRSMEVGTLGVAAFLTMLGWVATPLIVIGDWKQFREEKSCCRLIRGGIGRSVFYPMWACTIGLMTVVTYEDGRRQYLRWQRERGTKV